MHKPFIVKLKPPAPPVAIKIRTAFIRLDAFLKRCNAVESGGQAKLEIQTGHVRVNSEVCTQRGKKLRAGDTVRFAGTTYLADASADEN
ncbi:MAG: RNA-binding S4 domain-containing protein [Oscillospiraceae bacterium]|nr:RNA-binding S4 domain-containing protein [Oscillospiraceae bacterium]